MNIPDFVQSALLNLHGSGFEAYIVGGCVRDLLLEKSPKDWDITTNARPDDILKIFPDAKYENIFGTVIVPIKNTDNETTDILEITTYRSEQGYSDKRHPDEIKFEDNIENDLARRDFTINALAMQFQPEHKTVDLFGGQKDLKLKIIRAVGEPSDRFKEDALRMLRAIRFACVLDYSMEPKTERAIIKMAGAIKFVAHERTRDELIKILASDHPDLGIILMHKTKLLQYILPELEQGIGVAQSGHHIYTVFKHSILSLQHCPSQDWRVRFAALLHDVGKPKTKNTADNKITFYNHEYVGARITKKILERLKFSRKDIEKITTLVLNHMFYYNPDEVTASSVRRLIVKVGKENLKDLIDVRIGDRLGSGTPKAKPYKLRHLEYMLERVQNDPVSVKMLKINGDDLMRGLKIPPSPKIGAILDCLLAEVIEDETRNTQEYLLKKSAELNKLNLEELRKKAKETIEEKRLEEDQSIKKSYHVK